MPPAGGFEAVKYKRNLPFRGPGSLVILGGVTLISVFGFYRVGKGNLEKRYVLIISTEKRGAIQGQLVAERVQLCPARRETWSSQDPAAYPLPYHALCPVRTLEASLIQSRSIYRELQREKAWSRIHLVPLLMAEGDRNLYQLQQAGLAKEKEVMKDVKGWEVSAVICLCDDGILMSCDPLPPFGLLSAAHNLLITSGSAGKERIYEREVPDTGHPPVMVRVNRVIFHYTSSKCAHIVVCISRPNRDAFVCEACSRCAFVDVGRSLSGVDGRIGVVSTIAVDQGHSFLTKSLAQVTSFSFLSLSINPVIFVRRRSPLSLVLGALVQHSGRCSFLIEPPTSVATKRTGSQHMHCYVASTHYPSRALKLACPDL